MEVLALPVVSTAAEAPELVSVPAPDRAVTVLLKPPRSTVAPEAIDRAA